MISLPPSVKIFVATKPVDIRKSFNGLSVCVQETLRADPLSGHLFVFFNKRRNIVKILFWDRSGYAIYLKRLEKGCFILPRVDATQTHVDLEAAQLGLILEGIDLSGARYRKRWQKTAA